MRGWQRRARGLLLPLLGAALAAACDDDGITPPRLAADEVKGVYQVCALAFTPTSRFLPVVDVRAGAFELAAAGVSRPALKLDATGSFELEYTPRGRFTDVEHRGSFGTGDGDVVLSFDNAGDVTPLLLPAVLGTEWDAAAKTLTAADPLPYTVGKADYERLLGESDPGIPSRVEGRLTGRFAQGACE